MRNLRKYIRQSWQILKQNKLYSFFYILGTALAISMVMVIAIGYNIRVGSIYPEVNRDRVMILSDLQETYGTYFKWTRNFTEDVLEKILTGVEGIEELCIYIEKGERLNVQRDVLSQTEKKNVSYFSEGIWKINQFDFIDGRPFTKDEVDNSSPQAVISESTAKSLFGGESAVGEKMLIDYQEFTVCGVVKDVSPLVYMSYADIYLPYTPHIEPPMHIYHTPFMTGNLSALILPKSPKDFDKIKAQIEENLSKINNTLDEVELSLLGGPNSFVEDNLSISVEGGKTDSASKHILQLLLIVLVIILVPTFNIAGIISSEMEDREAEVGIRKAFGAPRGKLLYSLINENLLLSFIGGIFGLLLSCLFIYIGYKWFLSLLDIPSLLTDSSTFSWLNLGMIFNYKVIVIAFISCLLMNFLSSIIPQYFSTKKNVITLLKRNSNVRGAKSRKVKNAWILLELLVVFVIAWMAIDPLYVLNYQKSIYDGFEHENVYTVEVPSISKGDPAYEPETSDGTVNYSRIVLDIIKNHPLVEGAHRDNNMPISNLNVKKGRISSSLDSVEIEVNMLRIPDKSYLLVQGISTSEKLDEESINENTVLISKSVANRFFVDGQAIGKELTLHERRAEQVRVIGVIDDAKTMQYEQPTPLVIGFYREFRSHYGGDLSKVSIDLFIKSKPGVSQEEFIKTFTEDIAGKLNMGNRYFNGIYPYSDRVENSNSQIAHQKSMYTILACFVLFNMFLGIFATFWLQSKKRRAEIGLRMAMGSSKRKVSRMFVIESIKMASLAALVGMIAVGNIVYFKGMFTYGEWQSPTYWPVTNWAAHFLIVSLIAYAVIILTVTLGTLIPASKAANTNPVDALRDE